MKENCWFGGKIVEVSAIGGSFVGDLIRGSLFSAQTTNLNQEQISVNKSHHNPNNRTHNLHSQTTNLQIKNKFSYPQKKNDYKGIENSNSLCELLNRE